MTRHPKTISIELRAWARDVRELQDRVEARRADLRTHGPDDVVDPLRRELDALAATLSAARDRLLAVAGELDVVERTEEREVRRVA